MAPRETKCKWCGKPCYWIQINGRWKLIEAGWTPFKRRFGDAPAPVLYTSDGLRIKCIILPPTREAEADGFSHIPHICPENPVLKRRRPMTRRERYNEETA